MIVMTMMVMMIVVAGGGEMMTIIVDDKNEGPCDYSDFLILFEPQSSSQYLCLLPN